MSGKSASHEILNIVTDFSRMQIGYWSVPLTSANTNYTTSVDPYVPGAWPYLLQALNWAKQYGLHVILDLHGAPGSQNGYDNSGQLTNNPQWGSNPDNVARTLDILRFMANNIGGMIDVLELLNEPAGYDASIGDIIGSFWKNGYQVVRNAAGGELKIMIMDAFLGVDVRISSLLCLLNVLRRRCVTRAGRTSLPTLPHKAL